MRPKRVVVKVGTNVMTTSGRVDTGYVHGLVDQLVQIRREGCEVALVTSGAIGLGAAELGRSERVTDLLTRQACAAVGQPILMNEYRLAFARAGITVAQVLVTQHVFADRNSYVNLRNAVERLLELGILPVFNENDSVATAEIGTAFGDNDRLSALVASKIDAELLIVLSDVAGFFDRDPRRYPEAELRRRVEAIDDQMFAGAGAAGSDYGTGGMATKLVAVRIAAAGGCTVVMAHGRRPAVVIDAVAGHEVGTTFLPQRKLSNRKRWILHAAPAGSIRIDDGAMAALRRNKSLLPRGVVAVTGQFARGEVIDVNGVAKLVSDLSSQELSAMLGRHSSEAERILGTARKVVARPEKLVFLDDER